MRQIPVLFLKILNRNPETLYFWLHLINQVKVRYALKYLLGRDKTVCHKSKCLMNVRLSGLKESARSLCCLWDK